MAVALDVKVFVEDQSNGSVLLDMKSTDTIAAVKERLHSVRGGAQGCDANPFLLTCAGNPVDGCVTLGELHCSSSSQENIVTLRLSLEQASPPKSSREDGDDYLYVMSVAGFPEWGFSAFFSKRKKRVEEP